MSLAGVLSRLDFFNWASLPGATFAAFKLEVKQAVVAAYRFSDFAASMFESLVRDNKYLLIKYVPNAANGPDHILNVDPDKTVWLLGTDGKFHQASFQRILLHEASHALYGTRDPLWGMDQAARDAAVSDANFDFSGPTVDQENQMMGDLGDGFTRASYFASQGTNSYGGVSDFTFGAAVDVAVFIDKLKLSANTLNMEGRPLTRDLLIGGSHEDSFYGGGKADFLWGFGGDDVLDGGSGNDYLNGGSGDDVLFGGAGDDTLDGGKSISGDIMRGGIGNDTYKVNDLLDVVVETAAGGTDTVIVTPGKLSQLFSFNFENIENVVVDSDGMRDVVVSGDSIVKITFDDEGGSITYALQDDPTEKIIDVVFSDADDTFVFDANGFQVSTGIIRSGTPEGFFWGINCVGISSGDHVDLSDLGIDAMVTSNITLSSATGLYLMKTGTRITVEGGGRFSNTSGNWYVVDIEAQLFSPYLSGGIQADMFII